MHFLVDVLAGKTYVASSMASGQMRSSVSDPGKIVVLQSSHNMYILDSIR
jgi:hypothetical protein